MNGRHFEAFWSRKMTLATGFKSFQAVQLGKLMKKG
jgi:hypothetical protein